MFFCLLSRKVGHAARSTDDFAKGLRGWPQIMARSEQGHFGAESKKRPVGRRQCLEIIPNLPVLCQLKLCRKCLQKGLLERDRGVEPLSQPWEGWAQPIYQSRNKTDCNSRPLPDKTSFHFGRFADPLVFLRG